MKEKMLGENEIIIIKEMRSMKIPYKYISDRFGISIERVKAICKGRKK